MAAAARTRGAQRISTVFAEDAGGTRVFGEGNIKKQKANERRLGFPRAKKDQLGQKHAEQRPAGQQRKQARSSRGSWMEWTGRGA